MGRANQLRLTEANKEPRADLKDFGQIVLTLLTRKTPPRSYITRLRARNVGILAIFKGIYKGQVGLITPQRQMPQSRRSRSSLSKQALRRKELHGKVSTGRSARKNSKTLHSPSPENEDPDHLIEAFKGMTPVPSVVRKST